MYYYKLENGIVCSPDPLEAGERITEAEYREYLERYMADICFDGSEKKPTITDRMGELLEENKPTVDKDGFKLELKYENGGFFWEIIPDESYTPASGSYTNPTEWTAGMQVYAGVNEDYISDGWYVYEGLVQRCIKDGSPISFTDTEFWEVI